MPPNGGNWWSTSALRSCNNLRWFEGDRARACTLVSGVSAASNSERRASQESVVLRVDASRLPVMLKIDQVVGLPGCRGRIARSVLRRPGGGMVRRQVADQVPFREDQGSDGLTWWTAATGDAALTWLKHWTRRSRAVVSAA